MRSNGAIDRIGRAIAELFAWAWRETASLLPAHLTSAGASVRAMLVTLDSAGAPASTGGAVRSWFGVWRYDAKSGRDEALVLLDPSKVLRRTLRLSALAARNLKAAVRLEAETFSPIRLEDAALGVAAVKPDPTGEGVLVRLAIARRADIENASAIAADRAERWRVAADFSADGPECVFASGAPGRAASPVLMALLAGMGLLAALSALDVRLARDADSLSEQRDELLAQARLDREGAARAQTAAARAAGYPVLADVLAGLAEPGEVPIERVSLEGRRLFVETADGQVTEYMAGRP